MASRRMIKKQGTLLLRWYNPSLRHTASLGDENGDNVHSPRLSQPRFRHSKLISQNHNGSSLGSKGGFGVLSGTSRGFPAFIFPAGFGSSLYRYMSSATGEDSGSVDRLVDIADLVTDETVEVVTTQVPGINEVAVAAADSAFPVAALQYLIDGVHSVTGLNWWAAIALTTILVQGPALPFVKKFDREAENKAILMWPRMVEIRVKWRSEMANGPNGAPKSREELNALFKQHGFSYITPFKGSLIRDSIFIIFFLAISNMVEKVPSFKTGGALWFTDLTAPDNLIVFPVLASLSFVLKSLSVMFPVEYNMQEGDEIDSTSREIKKCVTICARIFAFLILPITMDVPKAHFCYWITSNLFSSSYQLAYKHPAAISFLDLPGQPKSSAGRSMPHSESSSVSAFQPHNSENESKQSPKSSEGAVRRASSDAITKPRSTYLQGKLKGNKGDKKKKL